MRLVLSWWLLVVVSVVVVSEASGDQQQHQQFRTFTRYGRQNAADAKQLFFTNSRYGKRIPGPMGNMARLWSGGRPKGNVQPRADKFFINSRYGKRSPPAQSKEEFYPLLTESPAAESQFLVCKYSGLNHLYHCLQRSEESGWSAAADAAAAAKEGSEESSDE